MLEYANYTFYQGKKWLLLADASYAMCQGYGNCRQPRPGISIGLNPEDEGKRIALEIEKETSRAPGSIGPIYPKNLVEFITLSKVNPGEDDEPG